MTWTQPTMVSRINGTHVSFYTWMLKSKSKHLSCSYRKIVAHVYFTWTSCMIYLFHIICRVVCYFELCFFGEVQYLTIWSLSLHMLRQLNPYFKICVCVCVCASCLMHNVHASLFFLSFAKCWSLFPCFGSASVCMCVCVYLIECVYHFVHLWMW